MWKETLVCEPVFTSIDWRTESNFLSKPVVTSCDIIFKLVLASIFHGTNNSIKNQATEEM